jgi:hypothetical protein
MMSTSEARLSTLFTHKALNVTAVASLVGALVALTLYAFDSRELLGVSVWEKPLKFLLSALAYTATFSWLYSFVDRRKKFATLMGNLIAALLIVELIAIVGMASVGLTSHFNVSSPFHIGIWSLMATAISVVWGATFILGASLWNSQLMSRDLRLAVRWALGIALAGMGIAFTMTPPQPQQIEPENWAGIAGAHTIGAADGGPGLPFFGWSTEAGDLRISHFFGLHAIQVLPLLAVVLVLIGASYRLRISLITGVAVSYSLLVALTYTQALLGQSIVHWSSLVGAISLIILAVISTAITHQSNTSSSGDSQSHLAESNR